MSNNTISGNGRPTDRTIGNVGDIYMDSVSGNKYKCVGTRKIVTDTVSIYYIWVRQDVGGGSGGSVSDEQLMNAVNTALEQLTDSIEFKTEMVNEVIAALPTWTGGSY